MLSFKEKSALASTYYMDLAKGCGE